MRHCDPPHFRRAFPQNIVDHARAVALHLDAFYQGFFGVISVFCFECFGHRPDVRWPGGATAADII